MDSTASATASTASDSSSEDQVVRYYWRCSYSRCGRFISEEPIRCEDDVEATFCCIDCGEMDWLSKKSYKFTCKTCRKPATIPKDVWVRGRDWDTRDLECSQCERDTISCYSDRVSF
jgi:hypothetical protein